MSKSGNVKPLVFVQRRGWHKYWIRCCSAAVILLFVHLREMNTLVSTDLMQFCAGMWCL